MTIIINPVLIITLLAWTSALIVAGTATLTIGVVCFRWTIAMLDSLIEWLQVPETQKPLEIEDQAYTYFMDHYTREFCQNDTQPLHQ